MEIRAAAWRIGEAAKEEADGREADNAKEIRQSITEWCRRAEANGAALAHRWSRMPEEWREETADIVIGDVVTTTTNPDAIIDEEHGKWQKLGAPSREGGPLPDWGMVPALPRPEVGEMRAGAKRFKRATGQGADQIGPRDLADLSDETLDALSELMYCSEVLV